jgi:hypothetical protein
MQGTKLAVVVEKENGHSMHPLTHLHLWETCVEPSHQQIPIRLKQVLLKRNSIILRMGMVGDSPKVILI